MDAYSPWRKRGEPPFIVLLDGITDEGNFGSIIRSAEVLGAHGVVLGKRRSASLSAVAAKSSSARRTSYRREGDQPGRHHRTEAEKHLDGSGRPEGQDAHTIDMKGAIAIVVGSEGEGISRLVLEHCDFKARIPMKGQTGSLNAAVAAAVLMYEKIRQEAMK